MKPSVRIASVLLLCGAAIAATETEARQGQVDVTPTLVLPSMSGRDIFRYYCASCHGRDGRGTGPLAPELKTKPANLTKLTASNRGTFPDERVKAFITHGRADAPAHGSPDMPVWGPIFQAVDPSDAVARARIDNIVAYLKSIQAS
jgi:mono/diheme cytochrome c family protein